MICAVDFWRLRAWIVSVEPYEGHRLDIGRPDDYMRAIEEFEQRKHELLPPK
jgi:UTP-glucose-1-phosphate uridylyltransferase